MGSTHRPRGTGPAAPRVRALGSELRALHDRIHTLLDDARDGIPPSTDALDGDLLVHCRTFCSVLDQHHRTEDAVLFPWLVDARPALAPVVAKLVQDHELIAGLLDALARDLAAHATGPTVVRHLEGLDAIMESHFRFEERELVPLLDSLEGAPDLGESFWRGAEGPIDPAR